MISQNQLLVVRSGVIFTRSGVVESPYPIELSPKESASEFELHASMLEALATEEMLEAETASNLGAHKIDR